MTHSLQTKYAKLIGEFTGRMHRMDTQMSRGALGSVIAIYTLVFLKKLTKPQNTQTPRLDESMAYSFGVNKTGPGGWFAGQDNIHTSSMGLPLSKKWSVEVHTNPSVIRVLLKEYDDVVFERRFTEKGFETLRNTRSFNWEKVDGYLARTVSPLPGLDPMKAHDDICDELGIPKSERTQTRGR